MAKAGNATIGHMAPDELEAAVRRLQAARDAVPVAQAKARQIVEDARADVERARERLAAAIVKAARKGERQKDLAARTGYTRETIRRICRAAGIEPEE